MFFKEQAVGGGQTLEASVGTVLGGRYRVQSTLGTGGMAVVYKAQDSILGRCVALKTLHSRYAEEISFRARFKQEARVMASLDHENIVKVYDIAQDGEVPFIVAECVDGQDVGDVLKGTAEGRLGERFMRGVVGQLLEALDYAHRRGVIHRDIKPSNIIITREGTVKVADFGIARLVEEEEAGEPGEIIGSARYMSPEQLRGEETTSRSDLYSVGILLYHCLTGRPPFCGDAKSVARQQIHKDPTPPHRLNNEISPDLETVIMKALVKNPKDRYPSALVMLEELRRSTNAEGYVGTGGSRKRRRRNRGDSKKALLVSSVLALLETLASVPNVNAYFDYFAVDTLRNSGFQTKVVYQYREGYLPRGVTWGTDPAVGTLAPLGSTITVYATPKDQPQIVQAQTQFVQPQSQIQPQPPI
ncbi:MAG: protein kinase [Actinobacteria bacterium]|nr:protein kinase [Actinomycetota bacterium]